MRYLSARINVYLTRAPRNRGTTRTSPGLQKPANACDVFKAVQLYMLAAVRRRGGKKKRRSTVVRFFSFLCWPFKAVARVSSDNRSKIHREKISPQPSGKRALAHSRDIGVDTRVRLCSMRIEVRAIGSPRSYLFPTLKHGTSCNTGKG